MEKTCEWKEDGEDCFATTCKNLFEFNDGGPVQNGFEFCPYCGGKHSHGSGGDSGLDFGYRAPHCVKVLPEQGHYRLVER